jgi:hypothetical protein
MHVRAKLDELKALETSLSRVVCGCEPPASAGRPSIAASLKTYYLPRTKIASVCKVELVAASPKINPMSLFYLGISGLIFDDLLEMSKPQRKAR